MPLPKDVRDAVGSSPGVAGRPRPWWPAIRPLAVVIIALLSLSGIFVWIEHGRRVLRQEITALAGPTHDAVHRLRHSLATELALEGVYRSVDDSIVWQRYRRTIESERSAYRELDRLLAGLDEDASGPLVELRELVDRWHQREPVSDTPPSPQTVRSLQQSHRALYPAILDVLMELERVVERPVARPPEAASVERLEIKVAAALIVLALVAVVVLFQLGRRMRSMTLAAQANQRRLEQLAEEKAKLTRGMMHDLKNPLAIIDAYARLLESEARGALTSSQHTFVDRIQRASGQLLDTINDLLVLSGSVDDSTPLRAQSVDLGRIVRETANDYRTPFRSASLTFVVDCPDTLAPVRTVPSRVRQIIGNLLTNALKYTGPGGRVVVKTWDEDSDEGGTGGWTCVRVADTGIGIAPEYHERIFDDFYRVEPDRSEGMGLGLAISRRLARSLGGDLAVDSEPGRGSMFTLRLPREQSEAVRRPSDEAAGGARVG